MEDKFENIKQFCSFLCNHCDTDGYCPTDCDLLEKAREIPFEKINNKWIEYNGDIEKVARYIKQYRL